MPLGDDPRRPGLDAGAGALTPAEIADAAGLAADLATFDLQLRQYEKVVAQSGRVALAAAMANGREVYAAARRRAKADSTLAARIEPLRLAYRQGPKVDTTQQVAAGAQATHTRAQARATAAAARAAVAQQRADLAKLAQSLPSPRRRAPVAAPAPAPAPAGLPHPAVS